MQIGRRHVLLASGGMATMGLWSCLNLNRPPRNPERYDGALFPYCDSKTGRWGFIDVRGNVRISARFAGAGTFVEERAVVEPVMDRAAVIDTRGEVLFTLPSGNSLESCFADGLLGVHLSDDGICAYLDRTGKEIFRVRNRYPDPSSEGRVRFIDLERDLYGYVDLQGQPVIPARYASGERFSEGLAAAALPSDGTMQGFIDLLGNWIVPPGFERANPFSCGRARVRGGYIDKAAQRVILTDDDDIHLRYDDFSEGLARYEDWRGETPLVGFIDTGGAIVIPTQFERAHAFSEELAVAEKRDERCGFIDRSGHWAIRPSFDDAQPMRNGLARVKVRLHESDDGPFIPLRVGYIDRKGKWVFEWRDVQTPATLI